MEFSIVRSLLVLSVQYLTAETVLTRLITFGDSISDDGLNYDKKDFYGISRASSGNMWNEYLAKALCLKSFSYAHRGAEIGMRTDRIEDWGGIRWQIEQYLKNENGRVPDNDLIAYQVGGGNELLALLNQLLTKQKGLIQVMSEVGSLRGLNEDNLKMLLDAGAKNVFAVGLIGADVHPLTRDMEGVQDATEVINNINWDEVATFLELHNNTIAGANFRFYPIDELVKTLEGPPYNLRMEITPNRHLTRKEYLSYAFMRDGLHLTDKGQHGIANALKPMIKGAFGITCNTSPGPCKVENCKVEKCKVEKCKAAERQGFALLHTITVAMMCTFLLR